MLSTLSISFPLELESNITNHTLDRSPKTGTIPAVRRRHARPLELDSEGEEESKEKEGEPTRDKEEDTVEADKVPQRQVHRGFQLSINSNTEMPNVFNQIICLSCINQLFFYFFSAEG
jgi:hypothetical protein